MSKCNLKLALLGASSLLCVAGNTHAQTQQPSAPAAPSASGAVANSSAIQEVVVTAEKRSTNIMATPLAVSALSGAALKDKNVTDLEQLTATTPSLTFASQGPTAAVNIRGIGLSVVSPNVASGVPIYRDGLLAPTLLPNEPFLDVADVEVLRGPQGTLVGANSTGGAVFINTQNPKIGESGGYAEVEGGSYGHSDIQAAYNLPVNDVFAMRAAISWDRRDSYWKDSEPTSSTAPPPGAVNQLAGRLSFLYQPSSKFSALLKINAQDDEDGGMAHTPEPGTPPSFGYPTGHYELDYPDSHTQYRDYQVRIGLELKYLFDNGISFRSMSGVFYTHEYYRDEAYANITTTAAASAPFLNRIEDHVYSQEFNLVSPASWRFHWVLGTFSQFWPSHVSAFPQVPAPVQVDEGTTKSAHAIFGEGGYDLTPQLELHVGLRETFDHTYANGGVYLLAPPTPITLTGNDVGQTDNELTGRVGLNWTASPTQFVYVFFAKGAKTGGINGNGVPNFGPEEVYDYEGGLKSKWFGGRLRTEAGVFYMNYDGLQLATLSPVPGTTPLQAISNVGNSTIKGAEFSAQAHIAGLQVDSNLSYVDSSVSAGKLLNNYLYEIQGQNPIGTQCAPGQTAGCFNFTPFFQSANGVANPFSPRWTANIGAEYRFNLPEQATLTPRIDYSYMSSQWATVFDNPVDKFQVRRILNLSLTYVRADWKVTVYGTNITNAYYITGQTEGQNFWGPPAEYGVRLIKSF